MIQGSLDLSQHELSNPAPCLQLNDTFSHLSQVRTVTADHPQQNLGRVDRQKEKNDESARHFIDLVEIQEDGVS